MKVSSILKSLIDGTAFESIQRGLVKNGDVSITVNIQSGNSSESTSEDELQEVSGQSMEDSMQAQPGDGSTVEDSGVAEPESGSTVEDSDATQVENEDLPDRYIQEDENGNKIVYEKDESGNYVVNQEESLKATLAEIGVEIDEDGKKYIIVADWHTGEAPKEGMYVNNCLSRIAANYRPEGLKVWNDAMEQIMDVNPDIYDSGRGKLFDNEKYNTLIYTGDKMYLPDSWFDGVVSEINEAGTPKPAEGEQSPEATETPDGVQAENPDQNDPVNVGIADNNDGTFTYTEIYADGSCRVSVRVENKDGIMISAQIYGKDGNMISEWEEVSISENENYIKTTYYDENGENWTKIVRKSNIQEDGTYTVDTYYNGQGHECCVFDKDDKKISVEIYNENNKLTFEWEEISISENENYIKTTYYDENGENWTKIVRKSNIQEDGTYTVDTYYNGEGHECCVFDKDDKKISAETYNENNQLTSEWKETYNSESTTIIETKFYDKDEKVYKVTKTTYDNVNHTYKVAIFEDGKKPTTESYDSGGHLISKKIDYGPGKGYEVGKYEDDKCTERKYYDDDSNLLSRDEITYNDDDTYIAKTYNNSDILIGMKYYLKNDFLERELQILFNDKNECTGYKEIVHNEDGSYCVIEYDTAHNVISKKDYDKNGNELLSI